MSQTQKNANLWFLLFPPFFHSDVTFERGSLLIRPKSGEELYTAKKKIWFKNSPLCHVELGEVNYMGLSLFV